MVRVHCVVNSGICSFRLRRLVPPHILHEARVHIHPFGWGSLPFTNKKARMIDAADNLNF
jgi:hypothetical protein